jgi:hypothetical protein
VAGATAASNRYGDTLLAWVEFGQGGSTLVLARLYSATTGQWGEPFVVDFTTVPGVAVALPVASVSDSGDVVVAWVRRSAQSTTVYARHRAAANGTWTRSRAVRTDAGIQSLAVAAQANDEVDLLWTTSGSVQTARGRIQDVDAWQASRVLATAQSDQWFIASQFSFAVLPVGGVLVVWEEAGGNVFGLVRARRLDANGVPTGAGPTFVSVVGANAVTRPSVAVHQPDNGNGGGHVTVAWRWTGNSEDRILARRWNASTDTWEGQADQPLTLATVNNSEHRMGFVKVVAAPGIWRWNRPTQVVWAETRPANGVLRLRGVALPSPTEAPEAAATLVEDTAQGVNNAPSTSQRAPQAVVDRAGNLLLVYEHPIAYDQNTGLSTELRSLRRQGRTGLWSSAVLSTDQPTRRKQPLLVGAGETGSAWAFWESLGPSNNPQIVGRPFD